MLWLPAGKMWKHIWLVLLLVNHVPSTHIYHNISKLTQLFIVDQIKAMLTWQHYQLLWGIGISYHRLLGHLTTIYIPYSWRTKHLPSPCLSNHVTPFPLPQQPYLSLCFNNHASSFLSVLLCFPFPHLSIHVSTFPLSQYVCLFISSLQSCLSFSLWLYPWCDLYIPASYPLPGDHFFLFLSLGLMYLSHLPSGTMPLFHLSVLCAVPPFSMYHASLLSFPVYHASFHHSSVS